MITFLSFFNLNGETYTENFDVTDNWSGGAGYTTRSYTNSSAPGGLSFISNDVYREGSNTYSGSYAWRLDDDEGAYLNAEMSLTVQSFSIQMARWDNSPSPNVSIEYSTDGGSNYSQIGTIDGSYFTGGDRAYKAYEHTFASPISPDAGSTIIIRFYTISGERMYYDDFSIVYSTEQI